MKCVHPAIPSVCTNLIAKKRLERILCTVIVFINPIYVAQRKNMPTISDNNENMEAEEEDMDHFEENDRKSSEEESASVSGEGDDGEDQEEDEDEGGSTGKIVIICLKCV